MLLDNIHKMKPSADKRTQQDRKSRQGRWCRLHLQVMRGSFWMTEEQEVLQTALNTIITSLFTISHFRKVWLFSRYPLHRWQCMCGVYTSEVQNIAQHAFRTAVYVVLTTLSLHTHTHSYTHVWADHTYWKHFSGHYSTETDHLTGNHLITASFLWALWIARSLNSEVICMLILYECLIMTFIEGADNVDVSSKRCY